MYVFEVTTLRVGYGYPFAARSRNKNRRGQFSRIRSLGLCLKCKYAHAQQLLPLLGDSDRPSGIRGWEDSELMFTLRLLLLLSASAVFKGST